MGTISKVLACSGLCALAAAAALWIGLPCCTFGSGPGTAALAATGPDPSSEEKLPPEQARAVVPVSGMTCGGCGAAIKVAVMKLDGIVSVEADHKKGTATVTYVKEKVTVEKIVEAINKTGFRASPTKPDQGSYDRG